MHEREKKSRSIAMIDAVVVRGQAHRPVMM
jgi:hypothetical protein